MRTKFNYGVENIDVNGVEQMRSSELRVRPSITRLRRCGCARGRGRSQAARFSRLVNGAAGNAPFEPEWRHALLNGSPVALLLSNGR